MHLGITIGLGALALVFIILFTRENRYSKKLEGIVDGKNSDISILENWREKSIREFNDLTYAMDSKFRGLGFTGRSDTMITDDATKTLIKNIIEENREGFTTREEERKAKERAEKEAAQEKYRAHVLEQQKKYSSNGFEAATGSVGFVATADFSSSCDAGGADCG